LLGVMLLLAVDVPLDPLHLRQTDGKGAVPGLPRELAQVGPPAVNPATGPRLQVTKHIRNGHVRSQLGKNVNVVSDAVDAERNATRLLDNEAEAGVQVSSEGGIDPWVSLFGAKHNVVQEVGVRVGHGRSSGAHGSKPSPWALVVTPSGLRTAPVGLQLPS